MTNILYILVRLKKKSPMSNCLKLYVVILEKFQSFFFQVNFTLIMVNILKCIAVFISCILFTKKKTVNPPTIRSIESSKARVIGD